jgi:hypothetical protein
MPSVRFSDGYIEAAGRRGKAVAGRILRELERELLKPPRNQTAGKTKKYA